MYIHYTCSLTAYIEWKQEKQWSNNRQRGRVTLPLCIVAPASDNKEPSKKKKINWLQGAVGYAERDVHEIISKL